MILKNNLAKILALLALSISLNATESNNINGLYECNVKNETVTLKISDSSWDIKVFSKKISDLKSSPYITNKIWLSSFLKSVKDDALKTQKDRIKDLKLSHIDKTYIEKLEHSLDVLNKSFHSYTNLDKDTSASNSYFMNLKITGHYNYELDKAHFLGTISKKDDNTLLLVSKSNFLKKNLKIDLPNGQTSTCNKIN